MEWTYSESFAGIGAWGKAIKRVVKRHEDTCKLKWFAEIDKYASNSFAAIHEESEELNIMDITKDTKVKPMDVFFYSPPCQTFSIAGKRELTSVPKGNLFYDAVKFINQTNPKYAIMENVRGLPSGDSKQDFNNMLWYLEKIGYVNYWKILNTKNYGVPQNRDRVFIVSIRKDLYDLGKRFEFPKKMKLEKKLKDILEEKVDKKYYLSNEMVKKFVPSENGVRLGFVNQNTQASQVIDTNCVSQTLQAGTHGYAMGYIGVNIVGNLSSNGFGAMDVLDINGICKCLISNGGGNTEPKIVEIQRTPLKFLDRNGKNTDGQYSFCIDTVNSGGIKEKYTDGTFKIRKLTPLECFRLQGFDNSDYYKAVIAYENKWGKGKSDSQMYKRAGNSITVNVIEEILENLLYDRKQDGQQLSMF